MENKLPRVKVVNPNDSWFGTEYYIDGKKTKTTEVTVKELYAHCVLLEGKDGVRRCPDYWKLKKIRV